jgi:hypothetical protein
MRESGMIQYSAASVLERQSYGVLDSPREPGIGRAAGETRWPAMTKASQAADDFASAIWPAAA